MPVPGSLDNIPTQTSPSQYLASLTISRLMLHILWPPYAELPDSPCLVHIRIYAETFSRGAETALTLTRLMALDEPLAGNLVIG